MNTITIGKIRRAGPKRLEYVYTVKGEWKRYFNPKESMWVEYSEPVDTVPDSIAVLPLVGNVLVLASLMDAEIIVDEIDKDFYDCVDAVIGGYEQIMPGHVRFRRERLIQANRIVENPLHKTERKGSMVYFSGGVDAISTLVSHADEEPTLVSIWGADVPWNEEKAWKNVFEMNRKMADIHGLDLLTIRSNLRTALHEDNINVLSYDLVREWWWPAFHHSVAMMCLSAPVSNCLREKLYFAASYTQDRKKEWGDFVLASDPLIDNHVRFCGCQVVHDGNEYGRIDKCRRIGEYYQNRGIKPYLRVCYHMGENCGHCEKCVRTIMAIKLAGFDPREYGFTYSEEELPYRFAAALREMAAIERFAFLSLYTEFHEAYRKAYTADEVPAVLRLFYEAEMVQLADFLCPQRPESMITGQQEEMEDRQSMTEVEWEREKNRQLEAQLHEMEDSTSWRVTAPLRAGGKWLRKLLKKQK